MSNTTGPCPGEVLASTAQAALQVAWEWSHLFYALNHVMREARKALMVLSSGSDWKQTGLFGHRFLTSKAITYISFCLCLDIRSFPFSFCSYHSPPFFTPSQKFLLDLRHSSHSTSAFCLTTRLSQLFHLPITFPREG